jgi:hypothetical protein
LVDRNAVRKVVWSAGIVLATAEGRGTNEIKRHTNSSKSIVWRWQERYLDVDLDGLKHDKYRPSRVPPLPRGTSVLGDHEDGAGDSPNAIDWSCSALAEAVGISLSSLGRIWAKASLKPHLTRGFKVSNDPMFEEKATEIV